MLISLALFACTGPAANDSDPGSTDSDAVSTGSDAGATDSGADTGPADRVPDSEDCAPAAPPVGEVHRAVRAGVDEPFESGDQERYLASPPLTATDGLVAERAAEGTASRRDERREPRPGRHQVAVPGAREQVPGRISAQGEGGDSEERLG